MSLTHKHVKIFEKIHQKHKVSLDFLTLNFHKVVKLVKYAASLHCVIKRRLKITKNHRVIIRYNFLRKSLFPEKHSKPANKQLLPWSKRMILYKKKMRALEKLNNSEENPEEYDDVLDEQSTSDSALPPEEVQKKLKEQLELLKCGKRRFSVFPDGGNKRTSNSLRLSLDGASSGTATPKSDSLINCGKDNSKSDEFIATVDALSTGDQVKSTLMVEGCEKDVASDNDKASNVSASGEQVKDGDGVNSKDETRVSGGEGSSSCTLSASREDATLNTSDTSFERSNSVLESSCEGSPQHKKGLKFLDRLINKMQNASQSSHNTSKVKQSTPCKISYPNPVNKEDLKNKDETDDPLMEKDPKENGIKVNNGENIKIVKATPLNVPAAPNNTSILTPTEDLSSASSSPDFLGFPDFELTTSTIPGMLPTPIVCKPTENNKHSAFVSEDLDKFLLENSLGNTTKVELPKRKSFEDGLVCEGAPAPKMSMPLIPHDLVKPRTVAEKRSILQKKQSIKYYMIENENTIYRELKKRSKVGCANVSLVRNIQSLAVPFTRDCWRASAWLATTNGKFYFRMLNVDGINVKLIGGHGNHKQKFLKAKRNVKAKLKHGCPRGCRQSDSFKNIKYNPIFDLDQKEDEVRIEENNTLKDLKLPLCPNEEKPVKAGPLSTKCLLNSFEPDLGPLEIYKMPPIELEVYPKLNQPLDDFVKPYLKMILPSDSITKEWAEFAVSTLVTENQKTTNNTNNSFTFTIPYLNEQNNVLVRKIYNRKEDIEKLDGDEKLSFTNFIDKNNEFSVDCANILSEMINSVAIGLSGDSLIKDDPDIDYLNNRKLNDLITKRDSTDEPKQPSNVATKKTSRLLKELNRLNAIVVDAESLYNPEEKKCGNKYCEFGCVCQSLTGQPILRKHCKKTNCMLECTCKHVVTADLDDFKSSTLTTEDALLIRKKATAKLAKVEKDFCSTVVLTDKETFLINERNTDKKRTKKAPKRFADYDYTNELPTKIKVDDDNLSFPPPPTLYPYDISPINPVFKKFKHCNVSLLKLPELNDLEPWCMIHGLYKCFCNGEATSGELYELKKDDTIDKQEEEAVVYSRKPIYSFDKAEPASEYKFYDLEHDIKMTYYRAALDTCTRAIEIPARTYKAINKRRVNSNKRKIKAKENDKTKFILLQRINGALRYDAESSDMPLSAPPPPPSALPAVSAAPKQPSFLRNANNTKINVVEAPKENNELDPLHFEEEIAIVNQPVVLDSDLHDEEILPTQKTFTNEPTKHPIIASVCSLTETQPLNTSLLPSTMASSKRTSTPTISSNKGQMPFEQSTNSDSGNTLISAGISNNFNTLPSTFLAGDNSIDKNKLSKFHTVAISKLNMAVTSSMHSICNIQKKNTKNLPTPLPNTLSSHQWKLFLQAYIEGLIYVWEIKQESGVFFGATPTSTMPIVPNALSVINIKAINKKKLPLFPKMLNARFINDNTKTLSVLMTGQRTYWKIIGFINSSYDYLSQGGIFKPTPKSHPWLSAKINNLYKLLVLKQIKIEQQQKHQQILKQQEKQNRNKLNDLRKNNKIASIGLTPAPQSNLTIRKVTHDEIKNLILPIPVIGDHQWLALDLCNDFTHIYIPQWKNFLSDERVRKAISLSRKASKVVRIGHDPSSVDVYTSRESPRRIFLGPYSVGHVVDITLYQAVNSNMILREDFERTKFISFQPKTTGFWLYKRNGKLMYDIDMTFLQLPAPAKVIHDHGLNDDIEISLLPPAPKQVGSNYIDDVSLLPAATSLSNQKPVEVHLPDEIQLPVNISISKHVDTNDINDDDDDDDCFIVEDEPKNDVESKKCIENNSQEQTSELTKDKEDVQQIPTIQSDNSNKNSKSLSSTPPSPPASVCSTSSSLQPAIEAVKSAPPEIKFVAIPPNDNIQNKETPKIIITEQRTLKSATSANIDPLLIRPPNIIANKDLAKPDIDSSIQNILSQLHVGGNSPKYTSIVSGDRVYLVQSKETTASDSLPNLPKDLVILPEEQASVVGKPDKSKQLTFPNNKISSASSSAMPSERKSSTDSQTLKQAKIISVRTIQCNTEDQEPPLKKFIIQKPNPPMIEPQPPSTSQEVTKRSSLPPASKNKADAKEQNDNRHSYGGSSSSSSHPENEMTKKQNISSIRMQTQQTSQQAKFKQDVAKLKNIPVFKHTKNIPSSSSTNAPAERIEPAAPTNNNNNNNNTSHKWVPRTITAKRHSLPLSSAAVTKLSPRMPLSPAERTITNTQQHKYYQNLILKMKEAVLSRAAVSVIDTSPNSAYIVSVASGDAAKQQKGTPVTSTNTKPSEAEPKITTITTKPSTEVKRKISSSSSDIKKTSGGTPVTNLSTTKPTGTAISSASATSASSSTSKLMPEGQTSTATTSTTSTNLAPSATPRMSATIQQVTVGTFGGTQPFTKPTTSSMFTKPATSSLFTKPTKSPTSDDTLELGFVVSEVPLLGKYQVKKIGETYLLKMPHIKGTLRILGINMLNKYLSQYVRQQFNEPSLTKARWHFVSSGKHAPMKPSKRNLLQSNEKLAPQPKNPRLEQVPTSNAESKQPVEATAKGTVTQANNLNHQNGVLSAKVVASSYKKIPATISTIANTTIKRSDGSKKIVLKIPSSSSSPSPSSTIPLVGRPPKDPASSCARYKIVHNADDKTKQIQATEAKLKQLKDFNITPVKSSTGKPTTLIAPKPAAPPAAATLSSSPITTSSASVTTSSPAASPATVTTTTSSIAKPAIKKVAQRTPPALIPTQNFIPHHNKNSEVILIEE